MSTLQKLALGGTFSETNFLNDPFKKRKRRKKSKNRLSTKSLNKSCKKSKRGKCKTGIVSNLNRHR